MAEIKLTPSNGPCHNFVVDGKEEKKTVWISPVSVRDAQNRTVIAWRCSLGNYCQAAFCLYARARHQDDDVEEHGL